MKKRYLLILVGILLVSGCSKNENRAPTIEYQSDGRVSVIKEATFKNDKLHYYMFCVSEEKNLDNCNWKISVSDSVDVARAGNWYFYFKGVSKNGLESSVSNVVNVNVTEANLKDK